MSLEEIHRGGFDSFSTLSCFDALLQRAANTPISLKDYILFFYLIRECNIFGVCSGAATWLIWARSFGRGIWYTPCIQLAYARNVFHRFEALRLPNTSQGIQILEFISIKLVTRSAGAARFTHRCF